MKFVSIAFELFAIDERHLDLLQRLLHHGCLELSHAFCTLRPGKVGSCQTAIPQVDLIAMLLLCDLAGLGRAALPHRRGDSELMADSSLKDAGNTQALQGAAYVLRHYSLGVTRIPLHNMACASFNRHGAGVSGKHSQNVVRRIFTVEGLQVWRYRHGVCIQPPASDPMEFSRFTNNYVQKQKDLLAAVAERPLPGCFAKTHLWHGLHTAAVGTKFYHDSGLPLVPNVEDEEVATTISEGMWFQTLKYEAYVSHKKAIEALMTGDNLDAAYALAETEMSLIASYFKSSRITVPMPGQTQFDAISESLFLGNNFSPDLRVAAYNFSKVIGEPQLELLVDTYQAYVNPTEQLLSHTMMACLTKLPEALLWSKTALFIVNMCSAPKYFGVSFLKLPLKYVPHQLRVRLKA